MSDLVIRSDLAKRIRQIARQHNQPVEDFLETLLDNVRILAPKGTLAGLAEAAERANIQAGASDISERSREIINEEYARRAARWMNEEQDDMHG
jgi:hypothetical protein